MQNKRTMGLRVGWAMWALTAVGPLTAAAGPGDILATVTVERPLDGLGGDGQFGDPSLTASPDITASSVMETADGDLTVTFENADGAVTVTVADDTVTVAGDGPALEAETAEALLESYDAAVEDDAVFDAVNQAIVAARTE